MIAARLAVELLEDGSGRGPESGQGPISQPMQPRRPGPAARAMGFALVGGGHAYRDAGVPVVSPGAELPSGGFIRLGAANLVRDLRGGLPRVFAAQVRALARLRGEVGLAVAVGDVLPLALAGLWLRCPVVFLPTAKSDHIAPHLGIEVWLMRRFCRRVFTRDELTAENLRRRGVPAEFAGNLMMDLVADPGEPLYASPAPGASALGASVLGGIERGGNPVSSRVVALLPGSRKDADLNLEDLCLVAAALVALAPGKAWRFVVPLAAGMDLDRVERAVEKVGWNLVEVVHGESGGSGADAEARCAIGAKEAPPGLVAQATLRPDATVPDASDAKHTLASGGLDPRIDFWRGRFAACLDAAEVVVGLAGTANEQAAGLGRPVVAFPGRGTQFTRRFLDTQKRLLGDALLATPSDPLATASEVLSLLNDTPRMQRMAEIGRSRMGPPGGTAKVAAFVAGIVGG